MWLIFTVFLLQNCNQETVPCPTVYVECLGFEMDKHYSETKLQVLLSPAVLISRDSFEVNKKDITYRVVV
ncbi:hypothetical protein DPMN_103029 [Dreissena polymorpha]|uniref:Uncharacterized protein n=1 Tax=Dreissena polymorpha TaxID=45954 RepID=A0A9D4H943_DREPO|nr:hypothetical protein DPMN_103029 [Dreissena polymorpha]